LANDAAAIGMFSDEAKIAASLNHPNIVSVFDFGAAAEAYFIAMEYVPGANLMQLMNRLAVSAARLPVEVALYIAGEVARGLAHAHAKTDSRGQPLRLVHRDVSPQNVLLSYDGDVKISDFGIAKMESSAGRTQAGQVRGKLSYMSPEQSLGQPLDRRSDLFSLGVVLFEMLFGHKLHSVEGGEPDLYRRVAAFSGPPEGELETLPGAAATILRRTLQRDPEARYEDGTQIEAAVASALGVEGAMEARRALSAMLHRLVPEPVVGGRAVVRPSLRSAVTVAFPVEFAEEASELVSVAVPAEEPATEPSRTISSAELNTDTYRPAPGQESGTATASSGESHAVTSGAALPAVGAVAPAALVEPPTRTVRSAESMPLPAADSSPDRMSSTQIDAPRARPDSPWRGQGPLVALVGAVTLLGAAWFASSFELPGGSATPAATSAAAAPSIPPAIPAAPREGHVLLTARPAADLWIDGARTATQSVSVDVRVPAGSHTLRLSTSRVTREFRVDVAAGKDTRLNFDGVAGRLTMQP
ncbi:MAG TPA: serine/threonine-protein kinase, partial [bacterium]|nr:serine/threonine-protein kinase [bacterium]